MLMTWVLYGLALLLVAWTNCPPPLFAWTGPPCYYDFSARWFCHTLQVHTAPSLHLPLFLEETFLHTHKGGSLCALGICQLVGHRLVMPLLLRPQLVMHWLVMHALAKDSPGWPGDVSVTDLPCVHANLHGRSPYTNNG